MSRKIISYVQTDVGRKRTNNEDNFVWLPELWGKTGLTLIGAIDGVGGYEGGAEAAAITKNTIENYLQNFSFGSPLQLLKEAIINANNEVYKVRHTGNGFNRMSCVLTVAILDAEKEMMYIGHVGDSRGYVFRNNEMLKITKDHSTVGIKEDSGYLTEEEAMHHPRRNEINKMLGEQELDADDTEGYIEMTEHSFLPADTALFCSDGLTDLVTKAQMADILSQNNALEENVQLLIDKANELGGKDNITVALATYKAKKADSKKIYKRAIEVPIDDEGYNNEKTIKTKSSRKKKGWLLLIPLAFLIGFAANWNGSKNWFQSTKTTVDTPGFTKDTIPVIDSLNGLMQDSLVQATDTIKTDSSAVNNLIGY
ncbi:MAG: PP2C family protein-serine/threonine phosphatase [Niabella sp.]